MIDTYIIVLLIEPLNYMQNILNLPQQSSTSSMGVVWFQFIGVGGGLNKGSYNLDSAGSMIGRKSQGIQILKRYHARGGGLAP